MPQQYLVSTPTTTTATGRTASSAKRLRYDHSPNRRRAIRTPSDGGTGSVDCSTTTSRSRDVCDVSGTHTVAPVARVSQFSLIMFRLPPRREDGPGFLRGGLLRA